MKNYRKVFFLAFIIIYAIGVFAGGISLIRQENQQEVYAYLEDAVKTYDADFSESIMLTLKDNINLMMLCILSVLFKVISPGISVAILIRGYSAGFAILTAMRLYGMGGIPLCAANILSLALLIPALSACGVAAIGNITENRFDRKSFIKRGIFLAVFIIAAFVIDGILRGGLSAILTDFTAEFLTKK